MKKLLLLLLVAVMTATALSSCMIFHKHTYASEWSTNETHHWRVATCKHTDKQGDFGEHADSDGNSFCDVCNYKTGDGIWTQNSSSADGPLIWSPSITLKVVTEAEDNATGDLVYHFYSNWGRKPECVAPDKVAGAGKIILGNLGYAISDKAYELLSKYADNYELEENGDSAYLIYADGGSLAIAYTDIYSYNAAVDYIIDNLHDREYYASGVVEYKIFNIKEFIAAERDKEREKAFVKLENTLGKEATDELRRIYALYDEDLYIWLANVYEPNMVYKNKSYGGAFYYSNSARDYEGYLPDLESTGQALAIIDNSGLGAALGAEGRWGGGDSGKAYWGGADYLGANRSVADRTIYSHEFLPAEMWEQMYTFAKTLYDARDGYFYHPQWPTVSSNRKGRDSGWAKGIIQMYTKSSAYDPNEEMPLFYIPNASAAVSVSGRLGAVSVAEAVSKVIPTAAKELQSEASWKAYLDSGFAKGSYSICHNLNSRTSEIKSAGLWDFTLTYLEEHQKSNGLWEDEITYDSISGLMKVSSFWNKSRPFPNAKAALDSAMEIISRDNDEELDAIVYVYNPWVAMDNLFNACSDADQQELMTYLLDNTADLFSKTYEKIAKFKKDDGGFSYKPESSAHLSQEALVAVEGTAESDMNATSIGISSILNNMLAVYELDAAAPELYYEYDALYFLDILDGLDAVIKQKLDVEDPILNDFNSYNEQEGEEANGVVKYPSPYSSTNYGTETIENGVYKFFESEIVSNPFSDDITDKVLHVTTKVDDYNGDGKIDSADGIETSSSLFSTEFDIRNTALVGNSYELDMDMYFVSTSGTNPIMQIMFTQSATSNHSVWLNVYPDVDNNGTEDDTSDDKVYLRIDENFAGADGVKTQRIAERIPVQEWFNLRIEVYKMYDADANLSVKAKVFVNGVYRGESDSSHYSKGVYSDFAINTVKLAHGRWAANEIYLNNVWVAKTNTPYEKEYFDDSAFDKEVSAPSSYDFETTVTEGVFAEAYDTYNSADRTHTVQQTVIEIGGTRPTYVSGEETKSCDYGVFYSIVDDPIRSGNKVLSVNTKNTNGAKNAVISVDVEKRKGPRIHVIEYDLYFQHNLAANNIAFLRAMFIGADGEALTDEIDLNKNVSNRSGKTDDIYTTKLSPTAQLFDANKWYNFRVIVDSDGGDMYYQYSENGSDYFMVDYATSFSTAQTIARIDLICKTYNVGGTYYLDNINYYIADEVPEAEYIAGAFANVANPSATTATTYDFESGAIPTSDYFLATSRAYVDKAFIVQDASSEEYNTIANNSAYGKDYVKTDKYDPSYLMHSSGSMFYVVNDPTNASNKVLEVLTRAQTACNASIDVVGTKVNGGGSVYELTFDYYTDYTRWTQANLPILRAMFWDGNLQPVDDASTRHLSIISQVTSTNKYTFNTSKTVESEQTTKFEDGIKIAGELYDSHTWYRIKLIFSDGKRYTYIATKTGSNWSSFKQIGAATAVTVDAENMKVARLHFPTYKNTTRCYIDNISYEIKPTFKEP